MKKFTQLLFYASLTGVAACATAQAEQRADPADKNALVAEALSAAPAAIAGTATVKNWDGETLKAGSDDWVCYPSMPNLSGVCPMCLDKPWQAWLAAFANGETPDGGTVGISYMLAGDCANSNTDPAATAETADNEWGQEGPHLMILPGDAAALEGISHDRHGSEPYVMWRDTPYAHIMAPLPAK